MNCNAANEALERYAISGLPEEQLEEHLLICGACQEELTETESYVGAMRSAAQQIRRLDKPRRGWMLRIAIAWRPICAAGFAMVLLALLAGYQWHGTRAARLEPLAVMLEVSRGSGNAEAPAGRPLVLLLDLAELPEFSTYHVEVVNAVGERRAELDAQPATGKLYPTVSTRLKPGVHFVRLYSPQQELLREYPLEIKTPVVSASRR